MIDYLHILDQYEALFGSDSGIVSLREQIVRGESIIDRKNMNGHAVVSAFIFSPDKKKFLAIYHKEGDRRQQPGGHIDDMLSHPIIHALREVEEETGAYYIRLHDRHLNHNLCPLRIDLQDVIARPDKNETVHHHYDMQFVCIADERTKINDGDEGIVASQWKSIDELPDFMQERIAILLERLK